MNRVAAIILGLGVLANAGCESLGYYGQAVAGHARVLAGSRDIDRLVRGQAVSAELAGRLEAILEMRRFAVEHLQLPDNRSYTRYTALGREHVVWNVFAAPEFSTRPLTWCFAVAGCVAYRGYYSPDAANRFARALAMAGNDVFVAGIDAYSTLGYLPDPVLSSFIDYPGEEIAALLFHELAHQLIYVKDDSVFNESFASTVEQVGVERWLLHRGEADALRDYRRRRGYSRELAAMMLDYRARLQELYDAAPDQETRRRHKKQLLDDLYREYVTLGRQYGDPAGGARLKREDMNNALLSTFELYHGYVPAFRQLLDRHGGDLAAFYDAVRELAGMTAGDRNDTMGRIMKDSRGGP